MKYTKQERLDIGRRIYEGEISRYQAAEEYGISDYTARDYMRLYAKLNELPKRERKHTSSVSQLRKAEPATLADYESMSKEDLILELVKAKVAEARLKKGYEVKGDGSVVRYVNKSTK